VIEPLEHLYLRGHCTKTLPEAAHSFATLSPEQLEMTAFYKDEAKDTVFLRFYNAAREPCEASLAVDFKRPVSRVDLVDLKGDTMPDQQSLAFDGSTISVHVGPAQILTIAFAF
jgi:alpha-mannosidase